MEKAAEYMKTVAIVASLGGVGYLIYLQMTERKEPNNLAEAAAEVVRKASSQDASGTGSVGDAVDSFKKGDIAAGLKSTAVSALKGMPLGHTMEALNPENDNGDRTISAGLAYGGIIFPPMNVVSWALPAGNKATGEYWENAGEKGWKDVQDWFGKKSIRHEEFHWDPPSPKEGLYRELWYKMQKWLDDYHWQIHPENRYADFWADGYTRKVVDDFAKKGHALNNQDIQFMNKWFDYFLYYNYEKRGALGDYWQLKSSGKIKDPKTDVYRAVSNKYYEWIKERKNPDREHDYKKFWESDDVKKITGSGAAKVKAKMDSAGYLKVTNQPGVMWTDRDTQFMNTAFEVENAEIYWLEKTHGRID